MDQNIKIFVISLWSWIWLFFLFLLTDGFWSWKEIIREQYQILWILIWIFWLLGGLLRNMKDKNTKILKNIIIRCEIYFLLLIFIQPSINLSQGEFFILYLASTGLVYEFITVRYQKRKKYFFTVCYGLIFIFLVSIAIFMPWRKSFNKQNFINHQEYLLMTYFDWTLSPQYTKITLYSEKTAKNITLQPFYQSFTLEKNTEYTLWFSAQEEENTNYLILQDPSWNILKIWSQSQVHFSTSWNILYIHQQRGNIEMFPITTFSLLSELSGFQTLYKNNEKNFILNHLPLRFQKNKKIQKWSINYTFFLAKIFPFWYEENEEILQDYLPYLELDTQIKKYWNVENSIIRESSKIWRGKISWLKKYQEYLLDFF